MRRKLTIILLTICLFFTTSLKNPRNEVNAFALTAGMTSAVLISLTVGLGVQIIIESGAMEAAAKGISTFVSNAYQGAVAVAETVKAGFTARFSKDITTGKAQTSDMALFTTSLAAWMTAQGAFLTTGATFNLLDLSKSNTNNLPLMEYNLGDFGLVTYSIPYPTFNNYFSDDSVNAARGKFYLTRSSYDNPQTFWPSFMSQNAHAVPGNFPADFNILNYQHEMLTFTAAELGLIGYPILIPGQNVRVGTGAIDKRFIPDTRPATAEDLIPGVLYYDFPLHFLSDDPKDKNLMLNGKKTPYIYNDNNLFLPTLFNNYDTIKNGTYYPSTGGLVFALLAAQGWGLSEADWGLKGHQGNSIPKDEEEAAGRFGGLLLPGLGGVIGIPKNPTLPGIDDGIIKNPEDIATGEEWDDVGVIVVPPIDIVFPKFPNIDLTPPSLGDMVTGGIIGSLLSWLAQILGSILGWIGEVIAFGFTSVFGWFGKVLSALGKITGITSVLNSILEFIKTLGAVISGAITSAFNWAFTLDQVKFKVAWENLVNVVELKLPLFFDLIGLFTGLFVAKNVNPPDFKITVPILWGGGTYSVFSVALLDPYIGLIRTTISIFVWLWWGWKMTKKLSHFFNH